MPKLNYIALYGSGWLAKLGSVYTTSCRGAELTLCSDSMQPSAVVPSLQRGVCWETSIIKPSPPVASWIPTIFNCYWYPPADDSLASRFWGSFLSPRAGTVEERLPCWNASLCLWGKAGLGTYPEQESAHSMCLCFCINKTFNAI